MIPADFPESNVTFKPPQELQESQCASVRAYFGEAQGGSLDGIKIVVVCWQPSEEERAAIAAGGNVFLTVGGNILMPHYLSTTFKEATHPA